MTEVTLLFQLIWRQYYQHDTMIKANAGCSVLIQLQVVIYCKYLITNLL